MEASKGNLLKVLEQGFKQLPLANRSDPNEILEYREELKFLIMRICSLPSNMKYQVKFDIGDPELRLIVDGK